MIFRSKEVNDSQNQMTNLTNQPTVTTEYTVSPVAPIQENHKNDSDLNVPGKTECLNLNSIDRNTTPLVIPQVQQPQEIVSYRHILSPINKERPSPSWDSANHN